MNAVDVLWEAYHEIRERHHNAGTVEDLIRGQVDALRAAVGGDRVVLQWGDDGEVTLRALRAATDEDVAFYKSTVINRFTNEPVWLAVAAGAAPLEPGGES